MLEKLGPSADIVDFNIRNTHMKHCLVTAGCVIFELNQKYVYCSSTDINFHPNHTTAGASIQGLECILLFVSRVPFILAVEVSWFAPTQQCFPLPNLAYECALRTSAKQSYTTMYNDQLDDVM